MDEDDSSNDTYHLLVFCDSTKHDKSDNACCHLRNTTVANGIDCPHKSTVIFSSTLASLAQAHQFNV